MTDIDINATHETPGVTCVHCQHVMTNTSGHADAPDDGDFTLCIQCGGLNVFDIHGQLRAPTRAEAREATLIDEVQDIHAAIMRAKAEAAKVN